MGFPQKVKNQIFVDTARHCCVCHRYKGVKVEVHHIKQQALGGENTYENAISLCFDCHCDAGHYNPMHPRGTKFSPSELKKAKQNWIELVKKNNIKEPTDPDAFLCQYFVCENYENLVEIANDDLSKFPVESPLIVKNQILKSLRTIIRTHPALYRHANAWGEQYKGKGDYLEKHPDALVNSEKDEKYSYFEIVRTPTRDELEKLAANDGVLKLMLEHGMPIENVSCIVGCYEDACGGVELQEEYIFRRVWCAFLAITNISDQPLALDAVEATIKIDSGFSVFPLLSNSTQHIGLPKVPIKPGATAILPLAVVLPPLYSLAREEWSSTSSVGYTEQVQVVSHEGVTSDNLNDTYTYGDVILPARLHYKKGGNIYNQEMHPFDLTNMYCIDRHWQCGSCPHLFFVSNEKMYQRELLAHCENLIGEDRFSIPCGVDSVIIAEIEDEITEIHEIYIDKQLYLSNLTLHKNEYIEIPVTKNSEVLIVGQYIPDGPANKTIPQGIKRNELVGQFMHSLSTWPNKSLQGIGIPALARRHP